MQDKPLFELDNEYEISLISEVLTDLAIPFRVDRPSALWGGYILGVASDNNIMPVGYHYAMLWGYEQDKERIGELLTEIRTAKPLDDIETSWQEGEHEQ